MKSRKCPRCTVVEIMQILLSQNSQYLYCMKSIPNFRGIGRLNKVVKFFRTSVSAWLLKKVVKI